MNKVKQSGADGLFLGGLIDENGAQVIKDKVKVLGPNDGDVKLYMPDGFTTQQTIDEAGVENTRNAFFSVAGVPTDEFESQAAEDFITTFQQSLGDEPGRPVRDLRRAGGSGARSPRSRRPTGPAPSVIEQMFATKVHGRLARRASRSTRTATRWPLARRDVVAFTIYNGQEELEVETIVLARPGERRRGEGRTSDSIRPIRGRASALPRAL